MSKAVGSNQYWLWDTDCGAISYAVEQTLLEIGLTLIKLPAIDAVETKEERNWQ
jgi:hypothetical protein